MSRLNFQLEATASGTAARAGRFRAAHGEVLTPVFMPVGTQATVKGLRADDLRTVGAQVLLANTYHLLLRPGVEVFEKFGGIHRFMGWDLPVLTDSGGYQIFSLPGSRDITEEGAAFRSYVDGTVTMLTPERSIATQRAIGSDIMMVLDVCVPSTSDRKVAAAAMARTHRWAKRSLAARGNSPQAMFGIVQGALFEDLRRESAEALTAMPFDGFAIGGLAVGEAKGEREHFTEVSARFLPAHLPRYLMGVGTPIDLLEAVHRGVDMFDCILPTAHAQQGTAFTCSGRLHFRRSAYKFSEEPIDATCTCMTCRTYSRAYVHHLVKADEGLGWRLIALHNVHFYQQLMAEMRAAIFADRFLDYYKMRQPFLAATDAAAPTPKRNRPRAPLSLGRFEMRVDSTGVGRIHDAGSGEGMHPGAPPDREAEEVYVGGARLGELAAADGDTLVVWDVGLGAAHNAMAAVRCVTAKPLARPIRMVSFEHDLDALRLALKHPSRFPHVRHPAPHHVAEHGHWRASEADLEWRLLPGSFRDAMADAPPPHVIFWDPFSSKTDTDMWSLSCLRQVFDACASGEAMLYTYSTSTAVRATLLAAGFYVAAGAGAAGRAESTVAATPAARARLNGATLAGRWLERWERSSSRHPTSLAGSEIAAFEAAVRAHPQFA